MGYDRVGLDRAIAGAKVSLDSHVKRLGDQGKDAKFLRRNTKWRQIYALMQSLRRRVSAIDRREKLEAELVAARAVPKAPKVPRPAKAEAAAPKAKKSK